MKKILFLVCICCSLFSCKTDTEKLIEDSKKELQEYEKKEKVAKRVEEIMKKSVKNIYTDTTGVGQSPVKVYKYKLVQEEYSNYRDIKLYFKNVSKKNITAIRFEWYGENAFNEPADMGSYTTVGAGSGNDDRGLKAGASMEAGYDINSKDGKKIISARAYEVMFEDGSKWTLRKK